jgi:hypothetical protein
VRTPAFLFVLSLFFPPQQPECADVASCRQAALDAAARGEFETFHDLAWRTAQKGRPNDPESMALVARAQSLSGRPGDALVMLRRLAQMGVAVDASGDDFGRVRSLAGWPEVEELLRRAAESRANTSPAPATAPASKLSAAVKPSAAPSSALPAGAAAPTPAGAVSPAVGHTEEPLPDTFASIEPAGLVYDAVSRRFIAGDRRENKLVIFDDVFKRATDMVTAGSAGFFGVTALELDARRGDLWVANSSAERGAAVHKLQLISGRLLYEVAVPAEMGPARLVDAAILPDGTLLLLDAEGRRLLTLPSAQRAFKSGARIDVEAPTSLAVQGASVAYVSHPGGVLRVDLSAKTAAGVRNAPEGLQRIRILDGSLVGVQAATSGHRLVRLRLNAAGRQVTRVDVLDTLDDLPNASGITISNGAVFYIAQANGARQLRQIILDRGASPRRTPQRRRSRGPLRPAPLRRPR